MFPIRLIEQQLDWLPYRQARNPVRFLIAAIENAYAPPRELPYPDNLSDGPLSSTEVEENHNRREDSTAAEAGEALDQAPEVLYEQGTEGAGSIEPH